MDSSVFTDIGINAYVYTEWQKKKLKTKVVDRKKGKSLIEWNQMFSFGIQWPMAHDRLVLHMMDEDTLSGDDAAGSIILHLKDVVKKCSVLGGKL